ncbi:MAG: GPR endopeptidase [Firmicutes bacterium]|nr:GPR endopeptidase [Bacillota bacterium]
MEDQNFDLIGQIHTDLALEAREMVMNRAQGQEPPGVGTVTEKQGDTLITRVHIQTEEAGRAMNKIPGFYVTLEAPGLRTTDRDLHEEIAFLTAREIEGFIGRIGVKEEDTCLVIGLGNWDATPDALGPKVVSHILVTRHLKGLTPPEKKGGLRPVCALAPGVLGSTGMETGEIVMGVAQRIQPRFIVVVDALASRATGRMGGVIQIADTGIHPGSGLGNKRIGITPQTMGVPVIAIGVPTVVEATTIVHDALEELFKNHPGMLNLRAIDEKDLIRKVLSPYMGSLIVTPKEIDVMIDGLARVVSGALNIALHPAVSPEEVFRYLS